jgi:4'-phosphopantetheinyl transferase
MWTPSPPVDALYLPLAGEMHVWLVPLVDVPSDDRTVAATLTRAERERAVHFASPLLIRRFVCRRVALRRILTMYRRVRAQDITFGLGAHGKPYILEQDGTASPLKFNISDTGDHVLIAVMMHREIGIDIETVRQVEEADYIVEQHFSSIERATYGSLAPERKLLSFFTGWTRKEAYVKAIGLGLRLPLKSFSVTIDPVAPARFIEIDGDPLKATQWNLLPISISPRHVGAVASQGAIRVLRAWTWRA